MAGICGKRRQLGGVFGVLLGVGVVGGAVRGDFFMPAGAAVKVATGTSGSNYTHAEGPIYDGIGNVLFGELNSTHSNDLIWSYNIASGVLTKPVTNSGGTQGDYYKGGQLVTADRDSRQISLRTAGDISVVQTVLASSFGGKQLNGPNDLVVDSAGGIFFTDPNFENFSNRQTQDAVFYITPLGALNQVLPLSNARPNGIVLSPDQKKLYVGLWGSNVVNVYDLTSAGVPTNGRTFVSATSPDGMTVDPWGDLIVARSGGVSAWSPAGVKLFDVATSETSFNATNVEVVGKSLYVTAGISLYRVPLTQVPEASTLGIVGGGMGLLLRRRRTR